MIREISFQKITFPPIKRQFLLENITILEVDACLPDLPVQTASAARKIRSFYQLQLRAYLHYCRQTLFPLAAEAFRRADASSFSPCTASLTGEITFQNDRILSLHTDSRECIGGPPELLRRGDTWDTVTGAPLLPERFFRSGTAIRPLLLQQAEQEILRQESDGTARYCDSLRLALRRTFNRENCYLTERGFTYYWPMHAIAPRTEGLPTFLIPFGQDGCLPADEIPTSSAT